jgi:hypothetical protein
MAGIAQSSTCADPDGFSHCLSRIEDAIAEWKIAIYEAAGRGESPEQLASRLDDVARGVKSHGNLLRWQYREVWDRLIAREKAAERRAQREAERERRTLGLAVSLNLIDHAFDPRGFFVYLLWGDNIERPLYVGQSRNLFARLGQHMSNRERKHLVKRVQVMRCKSEADMTSTENRLIALYQPPLNIVGIARTGV